MPAPWEAAISSTFREKALPLDALPLSEAVERYRVRILAQSEVLREAYPEQLVWIYENAWYISDLTANNMNGLRFEVAQLSDRFGPGPSAYMIISENLEIRA